MKITNFNKSAKRCPEPSEHVQNGLGSSPYGSNMDPRALHDGLGSVQDGSYTPPGLAPHELPRHLSDGPWSAQKAPKTLPKASKTALGASRTPPRGFLDSSKSSPDAPPKLDF